MLSALLLNALKGEDVVALNGEDVVALNGEDVIGCLCVVAGSFLVYEMVSLFCGVCAGADTDARFVMREPRSKSSKVGSVNAGSWNVGSDLSTNTGVPWCIVVLGCGLALASVWVSHKNSECTPYFV